MCDTPGCSLTNHHAGCHSFVLSLSGKRERQHTAKKSEQQRSADVPGATSTSAEAVQALGLLSSYLEGCGGAASMVEGWSVRFGPPRAHGARQDLTFFSPCGKTFRSKVEVARSLGLEMEAAKHSAVASSTSAEAVQALGLLSAHLENCGGAASMVKDWSIAFGPPRAHGSRQDLTFFSPCGKTFRSKVEVARFLGLEVVTARLNRTVASSSSVEAVQALGLLSAHLESCGGAAPMVEGWNVAFGPPRLKATGHGRSHARQDLTFFSPCGKAFRSKAEVARSFGLESGAPQQASSKRAKRTKPADHLNSHTLWVSAVVVEADDAGGDVDATVVDAQLLMLR